MIISEVVIPKMFTAYAEDMKYLGNGLHQIQYFCEECDQAFASAWGKLPNSMSWYERGKYFYCPYCGTQHGSHVAYIKHGEKVPYKTRLTLKTYKDLVLLEIYCDTVKFDDLFSVRGGKYKEVFRFDISKQIVTFSRFENGKCEFESLEIGNPFELDIFSKSILGFFQPNSLGNSDQKGELNGILKELRETVHGMLEKRLKYKIPSMYVSPGQRYGTFLLPIFNIAFRIAFPDAPNLPIEYREAPGTLKNFWAMQMIESHEYMADVMKLTRRKTDCTTALVTVKGLPNKAAVRQAVGQNIFEVDRVKAAFDLCKNYDYAIRLHAGLKALSTKSHIHSYQDLCAFLASMLPTYGERGIVQIVETVDGEDLWDCVQLYRQLSPENQEAISLEHVKVKALHDWMAKKHRRQSHKNQKFNVPDHIVKRLSMQTNRLKFFLPKESIELLEAGAELHNCVATYGTAMKDNSKWIVLVADDSGRLAACLEIQGKKLVQAKTDKNRLVANDSKLNADVLVWAKEANLEIKTTDVKLTEQAIINAQALVI